MLVHLDKFAMWAGLFMQIAGVIEALRRLGNNRDLFTIVPVAPQVTLAGVPTATAPARPVQQSRPVYQPSATSTASADAARVAAQARADQFDELDRIEADLHAMSPQQLRDDSASLIAIENRLEKFVHRKENGDLDNEANLADPIAKRARDIYHDGLLRAFNASEQPEPLSVRLTPPTPDDPPF